MTTPETPTPAEQPTHPTTNDSSIGLDDILDTFELDVKAYVGHGNSVSLIGESSNTAKHAIEAFVAQAVKEALEMVKTDIDYDIAKLTNHKPNTEDARCLTRQILVK